MYTVNSVRCLPALALALLLTAIPAAAGAEDPIAESFFTPELLRHTHELIGLDESQKAALQNEVDTFEARLREVNGKLQQEKQTLVELIKGERLDEPKVLEQAGKVLALETEAKRTQLTLLIRIKNALRPEQQAKLKQLRASYEAVQAKFRRAQELAGKLREQGGDVGGLEDAHQQFQELLRQGKFDEAEALLDKTLKHLTEKVGAAGK